jgi:ParB family protein of integrating conjugative element (PFGI_1 class)
MSASAKRTSSAPGAPVSLSFSDAAKNLGRTRIGTGTVGKAVAAGVAVTPADPETLRGAISPVLALQRKAPVSAAEALAVTAGPPSTVDLSPASQSSEPQRMRLRVTEIHAYDGNPRTVLNESVGDIRANLVANGLQRPLAVTQRKPGDPYILCFGSNTTLAVCRELWTAERDKRFEWLECLHVPYRGEVWLKANHLAENASRSSLTYWDEANGLADLKQMLDVQNGKPLSLREFEARLKELAVPGSLSSISKALFAATRLRNLGDVAHQLKKRDVEALQARLNATERLCSKLQILPDDFWANTVNGRLRAWREMAEQTESTAFSCEALCDAIDAHAAASVSVESADFREMLRQLSRNPQIGADHLLKFKRATNAPEATSPPQDVQERKTAGRLAATQEGDDTAAFSPSVPSSNDVGDRLSTRASSQGSQPADAGATFDAPKSVATKPRSALQNDPRMPNEEEYVDATRAIAAALTDTVAAYPGANFEGVVPFPTFAPVQYVAIDALLRLAEACEVDDFVRLHPAMPVGYFMTLPAPDAGADPLPVQARSGLRHPYSYRAWWFLAGLSGQFHPAVRAALAQADRTEHMPWAADAALWQRAITERIGPPTSQHVLDWLLQPREPTGLLALDFLLKVRALKGAFPQRWPDTITALADNQCFGHLLHRDVPAG